MVRIGGKIGGSAQKANEMRSCGTLNDLRNDQKLTKKRDVGLVTSVGVECFVGVNIDEMTSRVGSHDSCQDTLVDTLICIKASCIRQLEPQSPAISPAKNFEAPTQTPQRAQIQLHSSTILLIELKKL